MMRARWLRMAVMMVALGVSAGPAQARELAGTRQCPGATTAAASTAAQERTMRCLVNHARRAHGLRALRARAILHKSARAKARKIVLCRQFSHTPCGVKFGAYLSRYGYATGRWAAAENLAWKTRSAATPREIMQMWLDSPGHRANILTARWRHHGMHRQQVPASVWGSPASLWVLHLGVRG